MNKGRQRQEGGESQGFEGRGLDWGRGRGVCGEYL